MDLSYWNQHQSDVLMYLGQHIKITLLTLGIALLIAVPLGTLISRFPFLYTPIMAVLGFIYTIPSLALLAMLIPLVGVGLQNALLALVAYAQFILVRNVVVGLRAVDPITIDAARGMGMTRWQILFRIEYPLALPVILGGLRIATVATIAVATIGALVDAGGLGTMLFQGINQAYQSEIITGTIAVSLLALSADILLRLADRLLPATRARTARR